MKIPTGITSFFSTFWIKFAFILAIIVGLIGLGYKFGYDIRDRAALQAQQQAQKQEKKDIAEYQKQIDELLTKQHDLSSQLDQALTQNANVVIKYVTQTITKIVHDNPDQYKCTVPAAGMHGLADEANQLNNIRAGSSQKH